MLRIRISSVLNRRKANRQPRPFVGGKWCRLLGMKFYVDAVSWGWRAVPWYDEAQSVKQRKRNARMGRRTCVINFILEENAGDGILYERGRLVRVVALHIKVRIE